MRERADKQALLEIANENVERKVIERTSQLDNKNEELAETIGQLGCPRSVRHLRAAASSRWLFPHPLGPTSATSVLSPLANLMQDSTPRTLL
jgi:hypothetical protein